MKTLQIPLQLDSRLRLGVATGPAAVRAQIIDLLVTGQRERPFRPGYGAGLPEMVFDPLDPVIFRAKENEIRNVLTRSLRGGIVNSVVLSQPDVEGSTLRVDVLFSLSPGGEQFTATQTFTGLVSEESFNE